ncbi:hypothetical protein EW145_g997 [Phellinidium pouzarii]|uniref:PPM-type phosphatase domain-containing protein n=1 Tax=Phellinidium pouzarii TaxID=167371 RepID=A0A4S4LGQ7_9AGAM|nr:hypothetical protein EW145_g997 [Phellinidium pouzarii]
MSLNVKTAVLDDYQHVSLTAADWSSVQDRLLLDVFDDTLLDEDALVRRLEPYTIICTMRERTKFPPSLIDKLPNLRLITTTGMVNRGIGTQYAKAKGVTVSGTNAGGSSTLEHIWALILATARHVALDSANIKAGKQPWQSFIPLGLFGRTLGLVGAGNLGAATAKIARAFNMRVIAWSPNLTRERAEAAGVEFVASKEQLFRDSDIVSIHMVLSPGTVGMIGAGDFACMKPTSFFINTSRGPLVDETALIDALATKKIAGAGLDVFDIEPLPLAHPLRKLDNVTLTPHTGYVCDDAYKITDSSKMFWGQTVDNIAAIPRRYHTYIKASTPGRQSANPKASAILFRNSFAGGAMRIPLGSPQVIGIAESRGNRLQQEDSHQYAALTLDPEELRLSVKKNFNINWDPGAVGDAFARQVVFVGIYDGHGGQAVSLYLHQNLHGIFESVDKAHIPEVFAWTKELGGYFKRFKGGPLQPWLAQPPSKQEMDLEARATLAFLEADRVVHEAKTCGATASVALLHSLDVPATPFFSSQLVALTVAHVGDTRVLLCSTNGGEVVRMTQDHHADALIEAARLRRVGGSRLIMDSYGETRWMGALANTRGIGDMNFKSFGVTAEPEVRTKLLKGPEWAFIVFVTDGISSVLSDAEIVDLARYARDPRAAAKAILEFAEEIGSEDNLTALVVPLAGWSQVVGPDRTKPLLINALEQLGLRGDGECDL